MLTLNRQQIFALEMKSATDNDAKAWRPRCETQAAMAHHADT